MVTLTLLTFFVGVLADYVIRTQAEVWSSGERNRSHGGSCPSPGRIFAGLC